MKLSMPRAFIPTRTKYLILILSAGLGLWILAMPALAETDAAASDIDWLRLGMGLFG